MGIGCLLVGVSIMGLIYSPKVQELNRLNERLQERATVHLREQGGTALYYPPNWDKETDGSHFNYMIHSWDGGKNWYATEYDKDCGKSWGITILGDAKEMYPGLLEHIKGMDALYDYVENNGSIDGTDPAGLEALEDAGFTVKIDTSK